MFKEISAIPESNPENQKITYCTLKKVHSARKLFPPVQGERPSAKSSLP
jgi:hypothetical protein